MTSIEDKFYFGNHGQPERFAESNAQGDRDFRKLLQAYELSMGSRSQRSQVDFKLLQDVLSRPDYKPTEYGGMLSTHMLRKMIMNNLTGASGSSSKFDLSEACWDGYEPVGTKRKDGRTVPNCVPMKNEKPERFGLMRVELSDAGRSSMVSTDEFKRYAIANIPGVSRSDFLETMIEKVNAWAKQNGKGVRAKVAVKGMDFSRPGQPERFDASSLDRKGFAAASSSPMLGKLLSEKQMPEGGWRAVETGGGSLVISFEDGDVAGNFARRVASHGYSATAPVQSIGRYWNVEVKNGK